MIFYYFYFNKHTQKHTHSFVFIVDIASRKAKFELNKKKRVTNILLINYFVPERITVSSLFILLITLKFMILNNNTHKNKNTSTQRALFQL
jgi:hypothetical protein